MRSLTLSYHNPVVILPPTAYLKPIGQSIRESYQKELFGNVAVQRYSDLVKSDRTVSYRFRDLPDIEVKGFPIASGYTDAGELQFTFDKLNPNTHVIGIGTTGSGKTTSLVEPGLRAVCTKKNKPNLFLTDPKGEIFGRNAEYLRKQGYRLIAVNFKDVQHSDCWNPLAEIYDCHMRQKKLKDKLRYVEDCSLLQDYELCEDIPKTAKGFWAYGKGAYATVHSATEAYRCDLDAISTDTTDMVRQLSYILISEKIIGKNDPSWFLGAREILTGIIFAMLEDALDERTGFSRDNMNLMTIQKYFDTIRRETITERNNTPLLNTKKLSHKNEQCESIKELTAYFQNAPNTSRSYAGCFTNSMQDWFNSKIFTVCSGNSISIDTDTEEPFAIFLITRDYESSDFTIAKMFVDWIYRKLVRQTDENRGSLEKEMFFILDEFAQIPPIDSFDSKISTARSRNIWFLLFIQSYSQLETVYDPGRAKTIMENCNTHIFLGSQNHETKERFARECGTRSVLSYDSVMDPDIHRIVEHPLVTVNDLESISSGQMYMRRSGLPVTLTGFVPSYRCTELACKDHKTTRDLGLRSSPFSSERYTYAFLNSSKSLSEYIKESGIGSGEADYISLLRKMI